MVQKRGLNLCFLKDFLAPTPSVRQPLFETSDNSLAPFPGSSSIWGAQEPQQTTDFHRKPQETADVVHHLSGPNRAMQPRCAMRFESKPCLNFFVVTWLAC